MLDGAAAAMTACPSNATPEVMQIVRKSKGHIASSPGLDGTLEAINAHETDTINCELPSEITILKEQAKRRNSRGHSSGRHKDSNRLLQDLVLAGLCCATVLLAMASAKMLGPLSEYLMIPVEKAADLAVKMTTNIF